MIRKDELLALVNGMPDEVDIEELIHRLYVRQKVAAAEADVAAGRTLSSDEMRRQSEAWRK